MSGKADEQIRGRLRALYSAQLKQRDLILSDFLNRLKTESLVENDFIALESSAHKLNGTGATYGFPAITASAGALENQLRAGVRTRLALEPILENLLAEVRAAIGDESETSEVVLDEAGAPNKSASEPDSARYTAYRPVILSADDDPAILDAVQAALGAHMTVRRATSGQEVLAALRQNRFDAVLLDFSLPDMTALDVLIRARPMLSRSGTPVMMLTAMRQRDQVARLVSAGAKDYVVKPFKTDILVARMQTLLRASAPTILVADDDPLVREIFRGKMHRRGVNVILASNGEEALALARAHRPHAIVLDRGMPRRDGLAVLTDMRRDALLSDTPIVLLSAYGAPRDVATGYQCGANDYISKPFLPDDVIERCLAYLPQAAAAA